VILNTSDNDAEHSPDNLVAADSASADAAPGDAKSAANAKAGEDAAGDIKAAPDAKTFSDAKAVASAKAAPTAVIPADTDDMPGSDSHFYRNAGIYTLLIFVVTLWSWSCYMPKRSAYTPPPETELCARLIQAERFASQATNGKTADNLPLPPSCQTVAVGTGAKLPTPTVTRDLIYRGGPKFVALAAEADVPANGSQSVDWSARVEELLKDLVVWNRYEEELWDFRWGKDLNWYLHSSLRALVIILSAITPALIVAPLFAKKKYLAALPAAIVAIGTACISEFDFKAEAASYDTARVQLEGEKTAFITRANPFYDFEASGKKAGDQTTTAESVTPPGKAAAPAGAAAAAKAIAAAAAKTTADAKAAASQQTERGCRDGSVPFPPPNGYKEARANFACRIQQILQIRTGERVQFLRGGQAAQKPPP
jgi:hypothetical protein